MKAETGIDETGSRFTKDFIQSPFVILSKSLDILNCNTLIIYVINHFLKLIPSIAKMASFHFFFFKTSCGAFPRSYRDFHKLRIDGLPSIHQICSSNGYGRFTPSRAALKNLYRLRNSRSLTR